MKSYLSFQRKIKKVIIKKYINKSLALIKNNKNNKKLNKSLLKKIKLIIKLIKVVIKLHGKLVN